MLKTTLTHPEILQALASGGHGARVLIADGNYPFSTSAPPSAKRVFLNLAPDLLKATDVLSVLVSAIPVEAAAVMLQADGKEAPIISEFRMLLPGVAFRGLERLAFYEAVKSPETTLVIATGEQRIYANLLLTIGVVMPAAH